MGGIFPKAPEMPSAEEQYAIQKRLQEQSETEATQKAEMERRKASLAEQRRRAGSKSLITSRMGGLFGTLDESQLGTGSQSEYQSLYKIG